MVLDSATELGRTIGNMNNQISNLGGDISPDETDPLITSFNTEAMSLEGSAFLVSSTYASSSFILDHVVQGELDSSVYALDGGYSSTSTITTINF